MSEPEVFAEVSEQTFNPFEEKKEEVEPINPFTESYQKEVQEPKSQEEEFVPALEPEIVETKTISQEPEDVPVEVEKTQAEPEQAKKEVPISSSHVDEERGLFALLEEAGLTKGKIFGIFGVIVFLIFVIIYVFFGGNKTDTVVTNQESQSSETIVLSKEQNADDALNMSEILGNEYDYLVLGNDKISGAFFALRLGGEFVSSEHRFSYYMGHLTKMQNLYATDIYKLLDQSYDRRVTLTDFLNEMKTAIESGKQLQAEVAKAASNLDAADVSVNEQKDLFEVEFFTDVKDLRGQDSFVNLEKFIGFSQNAVRLRSYYKAYNYISEMYVNSLKKIEPRYQDIFVNFEALVKGIHVFEVPNSDINAIIRLSQ